MATWTKEVIRERLKVDSIWVCRGVVAIYTCQTVDEQINGTTTHKNNVGFNGIDAEILSSFATQILAWESVVAVNRKYDCPLSKKQMMIAKKRILKYSGQLVRIANKKI